MASLRGRIRIKLSLQQVELQAAAIDPGHACDQPTFASYTEHRECREFNGRRSGAG